ncbi:MAG: hypothetical protein AAB309_06970 [Deltaproteobacteria bacterium]
MELSLWQSLQDPSYFDEEIFKNMIFRRCFIHKLLELRKSVQSTNAIESMFSTGPRKIFRNVKQWRNSKQRQRYLALGLMEAEKRFRKLKGYRSINAWLSSRTIDSSRKVG